MNKFFNNQWTLYYKLEWSYIKNYWYEKEIYLCVSYEYYLVILVFTTDAI